MTQQIIFPFNSLISFILNKLIISYVNFQHEIGNWTFQKKHKNVIVKISEGERFESYYRSNINIYLGGKEHYQNIEQDGENV